MKHFHLIALVGVAASLTATSSVLAQDVAPAPALVPMPMEKANWRVIEVKNVPASLLAFQLDPAHNATPSQLAIPYPFDLGKSGETISPKQEKGVFDLPASIERLVPFDAQQLLLVKGGNAEDVRRLQELTDILDRPLRQVEIEAHLVQLSSEDLKKFLLSLSNNNALPNNSNFQVGFVPGNFQSKLDALVKEGHAQVLAAPRVTAINNLSASIAFLPDASKRTSVKAPATVTAAMNATPTINGDDTVTILMQPLTDINASNSHQLETVANVRDGDTLVLLQNYSPFAKPQQIEVIFVTARIIRRADEPK